MMRAVVLPVVILAVFLFGAVTLMATAPELEPQAPEPVATSVRIQVVDLQPIQLTVHSQGTVSPSTESQLIPEVSGRVVWVSPALVAGGYFSANDPLLRIESKDYSATLDRARAALTRAEAEHQHAQFEFERLRSLEVRQLASRSQMENALRVFRVSEAALQDAQVAYAQAQRDLSRTEITAPFDGLVRNESVDIGQFVGRGSPVATIYAGDWVEVRLPIADRQLAFLNLPVGHRGALPEDQRPKVTLSANYAGQEMTWNGRIVRTEAQIDTVSRMVSLVARVENAGQEAPLAVGLFVNADIEGLLAEDVVMLPRTALRKNNQVLVVDDNDALQFRDVEPLRLYQDSVLIRSGLHTGERVCISPMQTPVSGMRVIPVGAS